MTLVGWLLLASVVLNLVLLFRVAYLDEALDFAARAFAIYVVDAERKRRAGR